MHNLTFSNKQYYALLLNDVMENYVACFIQSEMSSYLRLRNIKFCVK